MRSLESTEEVELFLLHHGEKIVELIGGEIDRIEDVLKVRRSFIYNMDICVFRTSPSSSPMWS